MHRKSNRTPIDPSESGAMAAVSATTSSTLFSPFSHKTTPVHQDEDEGEDSGSESLDDDGLTSDSSDYESGIEDQDEDGLPTLQESPSMLDDTVQKVYDAHIGLPPAPKPKSSDDKVPKTAGLLGTKTPVAKTPGRQTSLPGYFDEESGAGTEPSIPGTPGTGLMTPSGSRVKIPGFKRNKSRAPSKKSNRKDFNFDVGSAADVQGIVVMEIQSASDLPKLKNGKSSSSTLKIMLMIALRFSFDMDPFVVISFGKKVFRTRVIRHQLNPVWDEKLLFHVRRNENAFTIQFAVLDWDKVSFWSLIDGC
jgi:phosphatidylserine decarboxylase